MRALVTGAGGMLGGWLVWRLLDDGHSVRAVDIKPISDWWQVHADADMIACSDIGDRANAAQACAGVDDVYHLACPMGGVEWMTAQRADCSTSALNTIQMARACVAMGVERMLLTSSACVYRADRQDDPAVRALREDDAYPCAAEPGYGESKWFEEQVCRYFRSDYGLETRIPRLHNAYFAPCTWIGGREKAPAAICRKVAEAVVSGDHRISIFGDGEQTRSFMDGRDAIEGIIRIMESGYAEPINLGSAELVTINELVTIVEQLVGVTLERSYDLTAPQGVRGRCSDNTLIKSVLDWEPSTSLRDGIGRLYPWIEAQVRAEGSAAMVGDSAR